MAKVMLEKGDFEIVIDLIKSAVDKSRLIKPSSLADEVGVNRSQLTRAFQHKKAVTAEKLFQMATILGITKDDIQASGASADCIEKMFGPETPDTEKDLVLNILFKRIKNGWVFESEDGQAVYIGPDTPQQKAEALILNEVSARMRELLRVIYPNPFVSE